MAYNSVIFNIQNFSTTPAAKGSKLVLIPTGSSSPLTSSTSILSGESKNYRFTDSSGIITVDELYPQTYTCKFVGLSHYVTPFNIRVPSAITASLNAKDILVNVITSSATTPVYVTASLITTTTISSLTGTFLYSDLTPIAKAHCTLTPFSRSISIYSSSLITDARLTQETNVSGAVTFAEILSGYYTVKTDYVDAFNIFVPDVSGAYNMKDIITYVVPSAASASLTSGSYYNISVSSSVYSLTAGQATTAISASHSLISDTCISASHALIADSSNTSTSASHALIADSSNTSTSASHALISNTSISASHSLIADTSTTTISASWASSSISASLATKAETVNDPISVGTLNFSGLRSIKYDTDLDQLQIRKGSTIVAYIDDNGQTLNNPYSLFISALSNGGNKLVYADAYGLIQAYATSSTLPYTMSNAVSSSLATKAETVADPLLVGTLNFQNAMSIKYDVETDALHTKRASQIVTVLDDNGLTIKTPRNLFVETLNGQGNKLVYADQYGLLDTYDTSSIIPVTTSNATSASLATKAETVADPLSVGTLNFSGLMSIKYDTDADQIQIKRGSDILSYFDNDGQVITSTRNLFIQNLNGQGNKLVYADQFGLLDTYDTSSIIPVTSSNASTASIALVAQKLTGSINLPISASIICDTSSIYIPPSKEGQIYWDAQDHTITVGVSPNVSMQVGQEVMQRVHAAENIPTGCVVYTNGSVYSDVAANAYRPIVNLALADGTGIKSTIFGVSTEAISSGSTGFVTVIGDIHGLNTDALTEGAPAYLSTTQSGSLTATRPNPPYEQVYCGIVSHKDATEGVLTVNIANPPPISLLTNAGMTNLPALSLSGSGTAGAILVTGTGTANLYNTADGSDTIKNYFLPAFTGSMPNTGSTYYLVANYNAGSPVYNLLTSKDTINHTTILNVATCVRPIYGGFEYITHDNFGYALANKLNKRFIRTERFAHETGLVLGESGSRAVTVTAGTMWFGAEAITSSAANSALTTCRLFQHSAASSTGWSSSIVTAYDNTQYDNGTTLATLTANRYGVNFVFKSLANGDNDIYLVLGAGDYTLPQAQASQPPAGLPAVLSPSEGLSTLVGRIIVQKSAATATQIDSAWATNFAASQTQDHNALSNLDGGTAGQYYHLTNAQWTTLLSGTSSWATSSISASYARSASWAPGGDATLISGALYNITSSWSETSSLSLNSLACEGTAAYANNSLACEGTAAYATTAAYADNANSAAYATDTSTINGISITQDVNSIYISGAYGIVTLPYDA